MSMYQMMHGENLDAEKLLYAISLERQQIARYRDIFLNADGTQVLILARVGGNNREDHEEFWHFIRRHRIGANLPLYERDYDDPYDETYAWIVMKVPTYALDVTQSLATGKEPQSLKEMTDETMTDFQRMTPEQLDTDPRFTKLKEGLKKALSGEGNGIIEI